MSVYFWRSGGLSLSPRAFFFSSFRFLRLSIVDMCCFRFSTHLHLPFNQLAEASFVRFYRRCHSSRKKKKHSNFFFLVTECYCLIGLYIWDFSLFFVIVCSWPFRYTFKKKSPSPTLHRSNGDFIIIDRKQSRHINRMKNNPNGNRYIFQFNWEHCYFLFRFISSLARFLCVSCFLLFRSSYVYHLLMWSTSTRMKEWKKNRRNLKWRNIATINKWKANKIKRIWRYVLLSSSLFPS